MISSIFTDANVLPDSSDLKVPFYGSNLRLSLPDQLLSRDDRPLESIYFYERGSDSEKTKCIHTNLLLSFRDGEFTGTGDEYI